MLSNDQKRRVAAEASRTIRLAWKRVPSSTLGELAANITHRIGEGTLTTPTFTEYADAQYRAAHAERVIARDEALDAILQDDKALRATLLVIKEALGPEGVVDFAYEHALDPKRCAELTEAPERDQPSLHDRGPELGD